MLFFLPVHLLVVADAFVELLLFELEDAVFVIDFEDLVREGVPVSWGPVRSAGAGLPANSGPAGVRASTDFASLYARIASDRTNTCMVLIYNKIINC